MFKDSFEGKIIRVDGFNNEEVTCKVYLNSKFHEEFPALNQHKCIQLCSKGIYQFVFTSASFCKSVSLRLSLFEDDGAQWLPLLDSNDFIECLPEETSAPRFLIVLCKSKSLHIIEESGEISEESSLSVSESEDLMPEIKLGDDVHNHVALTQEFLESIESDFLDQSSIHEENYQETSEIANSEKLNRIWEPDNSVFSETNDKTSFEICKDTNFKQALDEMTLNYQNLVKIGEVQNIRLVEYDLKFGKMIENFKDQIKRSQEREESLLELVTEKENEAKIAQEEIFRLRSEKKKLEIENLRLKDSCEGLSTELSLCNFSNLVQENAVLKNTIAELEKKLAKSSNLDEYNSKLSEKDMVISNLQRQLARVKPSDSDTKESQNSSISLYDELDDAVRFHAKAMNLNENLVKDKEQMYLYGHRKLSLMLINGNLMCRIGGSFKPFKEYMENFVLDSAGVKPFKKRFSVDNNIDSEYDADNFKEAQFRTKQNTGKGTRHSLVKRKTKSEKS